jgi:hypothetical protein
MAKAFPKSTFRGFDYHQGSVDIATKRAKEAGVSDRVTFSVAKSTDYPGTDYDLVAHFDCLHDMEDPVGAAKHTRKSLAKDGTWLIVEPFASDKPEENHNPVGRVFFPRRAPACHTPSPTTGRRSARRRARRACANSGRPGRPLASGARRRRRST